MEKNPDINLAIQFGPHQASSFRNTWLPCVPEMCCTFCLAVSIFHSRKINDKTNIKPSIAFSAQLQGMGSRQTAGGKEGFWILHFILLGVSELFWWCWQEVGKKALWQQLCPLSTHFSMHMCTPSTHCHIIWPAKAHRGKPTLVPLHSAMFDCLDGGAEKPGFFFFAF